MANVVCIICHKFKASVQEVVQHCKEIHEVQVFQCKKDPNCEQLLFETESELKIHYNIDHGEGYSCFFCGFKSNARKSCIATHVKSMHGHLIGLTPIPRSFAPSPIGTPDVKSSFHKLGLPKAGGTLIKRDYLINFDPKNSRPLWVLEILTLKMLETNIVQLHRPFNKAAKPDPLMPVSNKVLACINEDKRLVGGHLAAARNHSSELKKFDSTFYYTNFVPMYSATNNGIWSSIEDFGRHLAEFWDYVHVITGPVYNDSVSKFIPHLIFKIFVLEATGVEPQILSFVVPNLPSFEKGTSMFRFLSTLDDIEILTDLRFVTNMTCRKSTDNPFDYGFFRCWVCQESFKLKILFDQHLKTHGSDVLRKCRRCSFKFLPDKYDAHTDLCWYRCKLCLYKTSERSYFEGHMNVHNGIKPFKCRICRKAFAFKQSAVACAAKHSKEKIYLCLYCDYSSAKQEHIRRHLFQNHSDRPFQYRNRNTNLLVTASKSSVMRSTRGVVNRKTRIFAPRQRSTAVLQPNDAPITTPIPVPAFIPIGAFNPSASRFPSNGCTTSGSCQQPVSQDLITLSTPIVMPNAALSPSIVNELDNGEICDSASLKQQQSILIPASTKMTVAPTYENKTNRSRSPIPANSKMGSIHAKNTKKPGTTIRKPFDKVYKYQDLRKFFKK